MHKLMRYIKGYEKQAVLAPLFKMLEATFELFVPLVVASIIDTGIKNGDAVFIWQRCGLLILLAAIGLTCSLTAQYFSAKAALGFSTALRRDLFRHINTLSYSELDGIGTPDIGHPHDQRHQPGAERRKPDAAPAAAQPVHCHWRADHGLHHQLAADPCCLLRQRSLFR